MTRLLFNERLFYSALAMLFAFPGIALAQIDPGDFTWRGTQDGGSGTNFDDNLNWFGEVVVNGSLQTGNQAPNFAFSESSLKFDSTTTGTTIDNDYDPANNAGIPMILGHGSGSNTDSASFHFLDGSGDFTFTGFAVNDGTTAAGGTLLRMEATAGTTQTFDLPINLAGGNKNREIRILNGGTAIFNGAIDFANSRLFPNEGAGRIELNGNNTGVGLGLYSSSSEEFALTTNGGRSIMRNNVSGTVLSLGSDTALGDVGTGTWDAGDLQLRGIQGNQITIIETSNGPRDLSGYHFQLSNSSGAGAVRFNNAEDTSIGYVTRAGNGGRSISTTGAGVLSIEGGIFTSTTDLARDLSVWAGGTGGLVAGSNGQVVVNGRLFTSLIDPTSQATQGTTATGGIVAGLATDAIPGKQFLGVDGVTPVNGSLQTRFGTVTLNGDSSSTWIGGQLNINVGSKVIVGHENALGDSGSVVGIGNDSTLDLNGQTIDQTIISLDGNGFNGEGAIINSNTSTAAELTTEIVGLGYFSVGGAGDITFNNIRMEGGVTRLLTKVGAGTVTLGGDQLNNRYGLTIDEGTVRLSKDTGDGTAANAAARFDVLVNNGSTLVIANSAESTIGSGVNDQIDSQMLVNITDGTFDLAGNREGIGRLSGGATSVVTSSLAAFHGNADARIAIGEHVAAAAQGDGTGTWAGNIQDGTSAVSVSVNGGIQQSFTGTNTYSGETIVSSSVVSNLAEPPSTNLEVNGSITGTSKVTVESGAILSGTGSIVSSEWDISGTISAGGEVPTTSDDLTFDFSSADGTGVVALQDDATLAFVLDSGLQNSTLSLLGSSLDSLTIGDAILDITDLTAGSLNAGDYTLVDGDADTTFDIIGTVTILGLDTYASTDLNVVGNDLVLSISNDILPLPGDFNADGTVDAADYTVYRDNLGQDSAALNGNGVGAPVVIAADYSLWVSNYGASNSTSSSAAAAVPEPSSILMIVAGVAFCSVRRSKS